MYFKTLFLHFKILIISKKDLHNDLHLLRKGDRIFFRKLYALYYEKLCVYGLNYNQNRSIVEDLAQETFMYVWNNRKKIVISTSLKSYLYRIMYNKLMDSYRKRKKKDETLHDYFKEALNNVLESSSDIKEQKLKKLQVCLEALPKRCKKVFLDKKIRGFRSKEIAENMDISLKTVEGHITRAFKLVKECMTGFKKSFT